MAKNQSKTFKIGEYCAGGIITVEINGSKATVIQKEWDYSKGTRKGSNQKDAKELDRKSADFETSSSFANRHLSDFLYTLTTSYYVDQIMKFINDNVEGGKKEGHWC